MISILFGLLLGCSDKADAPQKAQKPTASQIKEATKMKEKPVVEEQPPDTTGNPLFNPALATEKSPENFTVLFATTKGDFLVNVTREWAPNGADRFYNLVKLGYYKDIAFFRVIGGFMAQFGMHGDPPVNNVWKRSTLQDDPVRESNKRGYVTFAKTGMPNSRSTQLFINYGNNSRLDNQGFAPIGVVVDEPSKGGGMSVVDKLYADYGEGGRGGRGPSQQLIGQRGNSYLRSEFPNLDYIVSTRICGEGKVENAPEYCP